MYVCACLLCVCVCEYFQLLFNIWYSCRSKLATNRTLNLLCKWKSNDANDANPGPALTRKLKANKLQQQMATNQKPKMSTTRLQMPANCRRGSRRPTKQTRTTNNMDFDSTRSLSLSRNNGPKQKLLFPLLVRTISIDSAGPCHAPTCPTTPATVTGNAPPGATSENICQM